MKKVIRFISMFIVLTFTLVISGCKEERPTFDKKNFTENGEVVVEVKERYTFVGYLKNDIDNKTAILYLPGSTIPQGEYEIIFVEDSKVNQTTKVYSYPEIANDGLTFAGWYKTSDFQKGTRVSTNNNQSANILYARYITFADACLVALVCILIVFLMLALLWGVVSLFKYLAPKTSNEKVNTKENNTIVNTPKKVFTMADITDDDMMVATLVATIAYRNETHENVRVVSVKQIG